MNRRLSTRWGVWIGLVVGLVVVGVEILIFSTLSQDGQVGAPMIFLGCAIGSFAVPVGTLCGFFVGHLLGERPRKPRDPDEAYPPAG
jgi:membrane protein DedA with SNARE-associated domain